MTYINYQGMWQITLSPLTNLPVCELIKSKFPDFTETYKSLFWTLFGYGTLAKNLKIFLPNLRWPKKNRADQDEFFEPEDMLKLREKLCQQGLTQRSFYEIMKEYNYTEKDVANDFNFAPNEPLTPSWVGELYLGLYHIFAVVVMLNLLIALMSNGFERGKDKVLTQTGSQERSFLFY